MKEVSDIRSNSNEQIVHAAEVIGRSKRKKAVFEAIYKGKKKVKTVSDIMEITKMDRVAVLQAGGVLASNHLVEQTKKDKQVAYKQDSFYQSRKHRILSLAGKGDKITKVPTKRSSGQTINIVKKYPPSKVVNVKQITVDDIDNFDQVGKIKELPKSIPLLENPFKKGVQKIIGEPGKFQDWGGERNDLYSTRIKINGKRLPAAFAFKGRGKSGKLVPGKMGKNGDQIQRLFDSSATVFVVQYWDVIDESVIDQMYRLAIAKSATENRLILFGTIDGKDTQRLIKAYPTFFEDKNQ